MRDRKAMIGMALLLFLIGLTYGGIDEWTTKGPWGGRTGRLCIHPTNPNILYTAHNGVLKTTDGGLTWAHSSNGIPLDMRHLMVSPSMAVNHPNVLHSNG